MFFPKLWCLALTMLVWFPISVCHAEGEAPFTPAQQAAVQAVEQHKSTILDANRKIFEFAEVGLEEYRSAKLLMDQLKESGFQVKSGIAGMPTAFVAEYGSGKPVIGILAEYDALPGMSQKTSPVRGALSEGKPGHACGHSGLGTGALGAVLAVKDVMAQKKLPGTIRLYGTPAEETVIGKVY
ncbi:MAG: M20/M25/M40 family metallo-hydrolase, partial [Planctomycetaceae bacterium]|nr:M20/M25/M40 family metallo-hydrolase [Planctomycetaceae bacterium]